MAETSLTWVMNEVEFCTCLREGKRAEKEISKFSEVPDLSGVIKSPNFDDKNYVLLGKRDPLRRGRHEIESMRV